MLMGAPVGALTPLAALGTTTRCCLPLLLAAPATCFIAAPMDLLLGTRTCTGRVLPIGMHGIAILFALHWRDASCF
jgi:hypothetical protein